jgi:hypothetical protein
MATIECGEIETYTSSRWCELGVAASSTVDALKG